MKESEENAVNAMTTMNVMMEAASGVMAHRQAFVNLLTDESGQDLIEYALVAGVLSLCAVASLQSVASKVLGLYMGIQSGLSSAF